MTRPTRAHPRSRGENVGQLVPVLSGQGSSPLTRGKPRLMLISRSWRGLIPAHAGKTWSSRKVARPIRAHPRSRGENRHDGQPPRLGHGSSPLTRGKRIGRDGGSRRTGLIPAHAGKTPRFISRPPRFRAHPRSRGENLRWRNRACYRGGSSPLTRGKPQGRMSRGGKRRLIPAHAGKTFRGTLKLHCDRAHPRSRGENTGGGQ